MRRKYVSGLKDHTFDVDAVVVRRVRLVAELIDFFRVLAFRHMRGSCLYLTRSALKKWLWSSRSVPQTVHRQACAWPGARAGPYDELPSPQTYASSPSAIRICAALPYRPVLDRLGSLAVSSVGFRNQAR